MKKLGFLSFGHWTPSPQSETRSGSDALLQSIDLAIEAERLGMDGAYFRVHHFARQFASPFPLLAAIGAKTKKIETLAWMEVNGQKRYEMIIKLGPDSMKNYMEGLSLIDCLPSEESLDWVILDVEKKTIELQLN